MDGEVGGAAAVLEPMNCGWGCGVVLCVGGWGGWVGGGACVRNAVDSVYVLAPLNPRSRNLTASNEQHVLMLVVVHWGRAFWGFG